MKTYLVTGGCGFIGSNFIKHVLREKKDASVINVDKMTYAAHPGTMRDVKSENYVFYRADISDAGELDGIFKKHDCDAVINFAAESHVDRSIISPQVFVETNVKGTLNLLQCALKYGIKRFLQVSTDEVYGSLGPEGKFTESSPISPRSPYSASKAAADMLAASFFHTYGLPVIISRCSNNYGPFQFPEKLIPLTVINALNGKEIPLYGDGRNVRDWIYVEDHVRAICMLVESGVSGEAYNIGGDSEFENIDIIRYILNKLDKPISLIKYVKDRPGHDRRYAMDFSRINKETGFKPEYRLREGLDATIKWYMDNKTWWTEIMSGNYYKEYYKSMYEGR